MSYILDALRKSSEERKKLQEHKEETYQPIASGTQAQGRRKRSVAGVLITFPLLAVLLALAGGWWYVSSDHSTQTTEKQSSIASGQASQPANPPQTDEPASSELSPPADNEAGSRTSLPAEGQTVQKDDPSAISRKSDLPLREELPLATQAALPDMKFNGHVYSPNPELRLIMVNNAVVREEDMITPEVKLVEITDNGLILDFRGTLFRVKLF